MSLCPVYCSNPVVIVMSDPITATTETMTVVADQSVPNAAVSTEHKINALPMGPLPP